VRKGRETYQQSYSKALELHARGKSVKEIAAELGVSYSAAYHWVRGIRKPEAGNVRDFESYLKDKGPSPAAEISKKFPKHNEIFHVAKERGIPVKRWVTSRPRTFGAYATWYYLSGQEAELKKRVIGTIKKFGEIKAKELFEE
jgi:hypothetical protein